MVRRTSGTDICYSYLVKVHICHQHLFSYPQLQVLGTGTSSSYLEKVQLHCAGSIDQKQEERK